MTERTEQEIMKYWSSREKVVSVCCITYNHEKYISEALDGFLTQETDFAFEVLINDDCSTDETAQIIRNYEKKYPNIIKPIYQNENQYSKGINPNQTVNFPRVQGKYIALCEGDDYWTDPLKLQLQVGFLEKNQEYSMCYHAYKLKKGDNLVNYDQDIKDTISFNDYLKKQTNIQTCTVVFRNKLKPIIPFELARKVTGSYFLFLRLSELGYLKYIGETMAVYRVHSGGIWSGKSHYDKVIMSLENTDAMLLYFKGNYKATKVLNASYICKALFYFNFYLVRLDLKNAINFFELARKKEFSIENCYCFFDYYTNLIKRKIGKNG